jgi:hypothetical protein
MYKIDHNTLGVSKCFYSTKIESNNGLDPKSLFLNRRWPMKIIHQQNIIFEPKNRHCQMHDNE